MQFGRTAAMILMNRSRRLSFLLVASGIAIACAAFIVPFRHADATSSPDPCSTVTLNYCSPVPSLSSATSTPSSTACSSLAASDLSLDLQQNVAGTAPNGAATYYNNAYYATASATQELAACLGVSVLLTSNFGADFIQSGGFTAPPTFEVLLPNGVDVNAGYLISTLVNVDGGDESRWMQQAIDPEENLPTPSSPGGGTSSTGVTGNAANPSCTFSANPATVASGGSVSALLELPECVFMRDWSDVQRV